jgi:hypothetical protein
MKKGILLVPTLALCLGFVACAKKIVGEAPEVTKARKAATYTAQSFVGLDSWSDATEILVNGSQLSANGAKASYTANETLRKIADQVADSIQAGKPKDAIGFIERGITEIEKAESNAIFKFKTAAAQQEFLLALAGVRIALESIRAALESTKEPGIPEEKSLMAAQQTNAAWWVELVRLGSNTYSRLYRISRFSTAAEGWEEARRVSGFLASKNAARLGQ